MALLKNSSLMGRLQSGYLLYRRDQNALIRPRLVEIAVMGKHKPEPDFATGQDVFLLIGFADNKQGSSFLPILACSRGAKCALDE